jgi:hypothetical protein
LVYLPNEWYLYFCLESWQREVITGCSSEGKAPISKHKANLLEDETMAQQMELLEWN